MADQQPFLPTPKPDVLPIPLPLIIIIAIGCYVFIIAVALIIRQCLQSRGVCGECGCCGKEEDQTCQCCLVLGQTCNCFECRGVNATLNRCCPHRTQVDCVDIILCQCCSPKSPGKEPLCGVGNIACNCGCSAPECENVNCLCFELRMKTPPEEILKQQAQQG